MTNAISPMPPYEWQQKIWDDFSLRLENNKLPHAFLLAGQEGIGVDELALAMGQYLLCLSPLNKIACGRCRGCQLLSAGTHPDLIRISPEESGKLIKVDQVREIAATVGQTAQQGGFKVILLAPAEAMNVNAANALLKNLEEPSGKTVFILVTYHLNRVLPTIRSRCSTINLFPPSGEESLAWLAATGLEDADTALYEAMGAPLLAKQWQEEGKIQERIDIVGDLAKISDRGLEPMAFAKKWSGNEPMQVLLPMLNSVDSMLSKMVANKDCPRHYQALSKACEHCKPSLLFKLRDRLCDRRAQLLASPNLNASLFIEELALDWAAVVKG